MVNHHHEKPFGRIFLVHFFKAKVGSCLASSFLPNSLHIWCPNVPKTDWKVPWKNSGTGRQALFFLKWPPFFRGEMLVFVWGYCFACLIAKKHMKKRTCDPGNPSK